VGQRANVASAANLLQSAAPPQLVAECNEVRRPAGLVQIKCRPVNRPVRLAVEVLRLEELRNLDDGLRVDQQAPQHAGLGLDVLRQQLLYSHSDGLPRTLISPVPMRVVGSLSTLERPF